MARGRQGFEEFVAQRDAARSARDAGRVTWRRVSASTGGGYSGLGAGGREMLVYVRFDPDARSRSNGHEFTGVWEFGWIRPGGWRSREGERRTFTSAKEAAAEMLARRLREEER